MYKGTFDAVLFEIAKQLRLQADKLMQYAHEAPFAAKRPDSGKWPSGTGSESEKRILYAVTKVLQPMRVYDIGTRWGSMTLQILSALKFPDVTTIDIERTIQGSPQPVGKFIPNTYQYQQVFADATKWIASNTQPESTGLIFEDTAHSEETTRKIYQSGIKALQPGGVIISHDAVHPKFNGAVVNGIRAAGIEPKVYLVEGDSCGLAIWQKPKKQLFVNTVEAESSIQYETTIDNEAVKEAPKRRQRGRKKASKMITMEGG